MAKRPAAPKGGSTYIVLQRYRTVVHGPYFDVGRVVETNVEHTAGEIALLLAAGKIEPGGKKAAAKAAAAEPEPVEADDGGDAAED